MELFGLRLEMFENIWGYREMFFRGIWVTLSLTAVGYVGGFLLGLIVAIANMSKRKWIQFPARLYVDFFRGTPLLVQILLIHTALIPSLFGHSLGFFVSGAIALMLNSGAYNAEIIRAGIQSLDKGQMEAARSLGMPHNTAMKLIILPQAFRRMIPPLGNELIALLKDSSLVTVIAAPDLLYAGKIVAGAYSRFWEPYLTVAVIYLALTYLCSRAIRYIENRFSNSYVPSSRKKLKTEKELPEGGNNIL